MPTGLKQPVGQKRLTNVAVVRLRKAGAVFEIACYKNKVSNWRAEIETDLDEVLQTTAVFSNVSKGIVAKEKQLQSAFGTTDEHKICLEILSKGELQVSEKERKLEYDNLYKDVASIIAEKCIDPQTNRQYTATIIERALKDVHFNPDLKKNAKQQAFSVALPLLQERFSIQRAHMRVQLHVPQAATAAIKEMIRSQEFVLEATRTEEETQMVMFVCLIEPGVYRSVHKSLEDITAGAGRVELMNLSALNETTEKPAAKSTHASTREVMNEEDLEAPVGASRPKRIEEKGGKEVIFCRGLIRDLSEDFPRKEMFLEIDALEAGWQVELLQSRDSDIVQAVFYSPSGESVGPFAKARRQALASTKRQ